MRRKEKPKYAPTDYFRKDGKPRHIKKDGTLYFQNSGKQGRKPNQGKLDGGMFSVRFTLSQEYFIWKTAKMKHISRCAVVRACIRYCMDNGVRI